MNKLILLVLLSFFTAPLYGQGIRPLPNAHAHNDYEHDRPLLDALSYGFTSVEADVHLIDGVLYVTHDRPDVPDTLRTLERLYLQPLHRRAAAGKGQVYPDYDVNFFLMIDFKTPAEPTYKALLTALKPYEEMLTTYREDTLIRRAVTVFISGNRPTATVQAETQNRIAFIDGRPNELRQDIPATLMPVVSDHYKRHLKWEGEGEVPVDEWRRLRQLTAQAHAEGKLVRLWASPENEAVWKVLQQAGVDFINTDDLKVLRQFLTN